MRYFNGILAVMLLFCMVDSLFAQTVERVTITTYFPAPYGNYNELRANKLAVGNRLMSSFGPGQIVWGFTGSGKGLLSADQGASIELGGSGTPYIDFSNNVASDFNARIILPNANVLRFEVGSEVQVMDPSGSAFRDMEVRDLYICP